MAAAENSEPSSLVSVPFTLYSTFVLRDVGLKYWLARYEHSKTVPAFALICFGQETPEFKDPACDRT